jgi:hypothetical protein
LATLGLENGGIHLVEMAHIQLWGRIFLHSEATLANFLINLFHHLKVKIIYAIAFFRSDHTLGHNVRDNHSNVLPPSPVPGRIPKQIDRNPFGGMAKCRVSAVKKYIQLHPRLTFGNHFPDLIWPPIWFPNAEQVRCIHVCHFEVVHRIYFWILDIWISS